MDRGYSYIEIIISMTLISILGLCLTNGVCIAVKNYNFSRENYFADITSENLLNMAEVNNSSLSDIFSGGSENFYTDKFNFTVRANQIMSDFSIDKNNFDEINYGGEEFLPIETQIFSGSRSLFDDISKNGCSNYLITVDLFNKKHKFLKRLTKII